jgi:hypothetical protein
MAIKWWLFWAWFSSNQDYTENGSNSLWALVLRACVTFSWDTPVWRHRLANVITDFSPDYAGEIMIDARIMGNFLVQPSCKRSLVQAGLTWPEVHAWLIPHRFTFSIAWNYKAKWRYISSLFSKNNHNALKDAWQSSLSVGEQGIQDIVIQLFIMYNIFILSLVFIAIVFLLFKSIYVCRIQTNYK